MLSLKLLGRFKYIGRKNDSHQTLRNARFFSVVGNFKKDGLKKITEIVMLAGPLARGTVRLLPANCC
jgi:hypothetical protein